MQNKLGMFIHFGLYSLLGDHEQVQAKRDIAHEEYNRLMLRFNPAAGAPEEWVKLAKASGMEYICFTTKHHDGFCLWDTKETDFSVMHTPCGRDILAELADACRRHGMKLSLYYSNPDWHHPNAYNPKSSHQWKSISYTSADSEAYRAFIKAQLRELLTGYGEIYSFFWDIPPMIDDPSMNALIRELQPAILINDRGYGKGDFSTPERTVPDGARFSSMTEACQSVGEQSWGYRKNEDYYSSAYLLASIDRVMAMGGSYLLNVGPMASGEIPGEAKRKLRAVGDFIARVRPALVDHAAEPNAIKLTSPDRFIACRRDGKTYLHFYEGLRSSAVTFAADIGEIHSARLLNGGESLALRRDCLPMQGDSTTGRAEKLCLSIAGIPVDDYPGEPLVLELER